MKDFHIRIADDNLVFSANISSPWIEAREPLHGHNYRVAAEVCGPLGENQYVVIFWPSATPCRRSCGNWIIACCCRPSIPQFR